MLVGRRSEVISPIINEQVNLKACVEVLRVDLIVLGYLTVFGNEEFLLEVYLQNGEAIHTNTNVHQPHHQNSHSHWSLQQKEC